jgi:RimJ/RimL family protein N-acetyltransferase
MSDKVKTPGYGPEDFDEPPTRPEIEGREGVALKQLYIEDAQAYFDLIEYDREHLSRYNDETAEKYPSVDAVALSITQPQNPMRQRYGIWHEETMVGSINLTPKADRSAEIGYWVGKQHIGNGYATKAVQALVRHAFETGDYPYLYALVHRENEASKRTLQKAGFTLARTKPETKEMMYILERPRPENT